MKMWIPMLILALSVTGFCIWESVYTNRTFSQLENEAEYIYTAVQTDQFGSADLTNRINSLNEFWTEKMKSVMKLDFSWKKTAKEYVEIYNELI